MTIVDLWFRVLFPACTCYGGSSLLALRRCSGGKAGTVRRKRSSPPPVVFPAFQAFLLPFLRSVGAQAAKPERSGSGGATVDLRFRLPLCQLLYQLLEFFAEKDKNAAKEEKSCGKFCQFQKKLYLCNRVSEEMTSRPARKGSRNYWKDNIKLERWRNW